VGGFTLRCTECGARWSEAPERLLCDRCVAGQVPGGVLRGVLEPELEVLPEAWPHAPPSDPSSVQPFLPLTDAELWPPLRVGGTPLLEVSRLRAELKMPHLWLKDDTRNPSGSTKDRASALVVAKALEYGKRVVATASTGNAATALAAVAASAGVQAVVLVPAGAPRAKLVQIAAYGARLVVVDGTYDDAFELSMAASRELGWYTRNTALNPFTTEGKKTVALEIARQMGPEPADAVVVTAGDGVICSGVAKGFRDAHRAGLIPSEPRLVVVQPEGSAAIATAVRDNHELPTPHPGASSVADSLVVAAPRGGVPAVQAVRRTGGGAVVVSDDEIVQAVVRLARLTGVFAEPAAAAALAGLERALAERLIDGDERVVLLITGTGLKDVPAAERAVTIPNPVAPDLTALAAYLRTRT
jgi:threonine synthase